jgi:hypothetical protein
VRISFGPEISFTFREEGVMSSTNKIKDHDDGSKALSQKMMVHGFVCPESSCNLSVEIRRGMPILSSEGLEVGKVAGARTMKQRRRPMFS